MTETTQPVIDHTIKVGDKWGSRVDWAWVEVLTIYENSIAYQWDNGVLAQRPTWEFLSIFVPPAKPQKESA